MPGLENMVMKMLKATIDTINSGKCNNKCHGF